MTSSWMDDDRLSLSTYNDDASSGKAKEKYKPTLDQVIKNVMQQKRVEILTKRQDIFGAAKQLSERLLLMTFSIHSLFRRYIRTRKSGKVDILDFRALDQNTFQCCVALIRPTRPQTFMFRYKRPREYPSHRMLLCLNDTIPKEERIQLQQEWGYCVDKKGVVRPDFVLRWFNQGLEVTIDAVVNEVVFLYDEHVKPKMAFQTSISPKDGTLWIEVTETKQRGDTNTFRINIIPCIPLQEIPKQLSLSVPIPKRRPYFETNTNFRNTITHSINRGCELFCLEARMFKWTLGTKFDPSIAVSWQVGSGPLEDKAYKIISEFTSGAHFDNIILIMGQIKRENRKAFQPISYRMILHAILQVHRRCMGQLKKCEDWLIAVLEFLKYQLHSKSALTFFLNKLDFLEGFDSKSLARSEKAIKTILRDLKRDSENLYKHVGCISQDDDESEETDEQESFEEARFESDNYITDVSKDSNAPESHRSNVEEKRWVYTENSRPVTADDQHWIQTEDENYSENFENSEDIPYISSDSKDNTTYQRRVESNETSIGDVMQADNEESDVDDNYEDESKGRGR